MYMGFTGRCCSHFAHIFTTGNQAAAGNLCILLSILSCGITCCNNYQCQGTLSRKDIELEHLQAKHHSYDTWGISQHLTNKYVHGVINRIIHFMCSL